MLKCWISSLVRGVHEDVVPVHLQLRLEGHAADGARRRRVHALVHRFDMDVHAVLFGELLAALGTPLLAVAALVILVCHLQLCLEGHASSSGGQNVRGQRASWP